MVNNSRSNNGTVIKYLLEDLLKMFHYALKGFTVLDSPYSQLCLIFLYSVKALLWCIRQEQYNRNQILEELSILNQEFKLSFNRCLLSTCYVPDSEFTVILSVWLVVLWCPSYAPRRLTSGSQGVVFLGSHLGSCFSQNTHVLCPSVPTPA